MVQMQKDTGQANSLTCCQLTLLSSGGTGSSDNCWITKTKATIIYRVFKLKFGRNNTMCENMYFVPLVAHET